MPAAVAVAPAAVTRMSLKPMAFSLPEGAPCASGKASARASLAATGGQAATQGRGRAVDAYIIPPPPPRSPPPRSGASRCGSVPAPAAGFRPAQAESESIPTMSAAMKGRRDLIASAQHEAPITPPQFSVRLEPSRRICHSGFGRGIVGTARGPAEPCMNDTQTAKVLPTAAPPESDERPLAAIGLVLLSLVLFSGLDACSKVLVADYSPVLITWGRYAANLALLLPFLLRAGPHPFATAGIGLQRSEERRVG